MDRKVLKRRKIIKKSVLTADDLFIEKEIVVSGTSYLGYLPFIFSELFGMYGLNSDDISKVLYLNELVYFNLIILINNNENKLTHLLDRDFIKKIILGKNTVYELSDKGKRLVVDFHKLILNKDIYISKNRLFETDNRIKLKSVLSKIKDL